VKILIADDDPVSRRLLEATLVRFGHEVIAVGDGREAVDLLLGADGPRLAILDWMMPNADGLTVCRTVRQRSVTYVYIIMLTSRDRREDLVAALDAEADDFLTKPYDVVELGARIRSGGRVLKLQEQLIAAHEALHHEATHDRLTGLLNRGRILDQLGRELSRCRREHHPLSVVLADVDHFKAVNDSHGHLAGDDVLRQVADRMRIQVADRDRLGRYGGEEFLAVLPACEAARARETAERLRAAVADAPMQAGRVMTSLTVSLGVATSDRSDDPPGVLVRASDEALYRAKNAGRNRVEVTSLSTR